MTKRREVKPEEQKPQTDAVTISKEKYIELKTKADILDKFLKGDK